MPPWNSGQASAPKPLMSSPIPPPPNLNRGPPRQGNPQPWNKPSPGNSGPPFGMQGELKFFFNFHFRSLFNLRFSKLNMFCELCSEI